MPARHISIADQVPAPIREGIARLRAELEVPDGFGPEVLAEAERRVAAGPLEVGERRDLTGLPFVTIDPEGSMDLDQAMHLERAEDAHVEVSAAHHREGVRVVEVCGARERRNGTNRHD